MTAITAIDGEGPYSPERAGSLPLVDFVAKVLAERLTLAQVKKLLASQSGLRSYLNDISIKNIVARIAEGDETAKFYLDRYSIYQIKKQIAEMAGVLNGQVDVIILTGGAAYATAVTAPLQHDLAWIAPVVVRRGEMEMQALYEGVMRVLNHEEPVRVYQSDASTIKRGNWQMTMNTDLVVLGGGPGGYVAAIRAAQLGMQVVLVEKAKVGGICLHKGCIPTKSLLHSGETLRLMQSAATFGGIIEGKVGIDFAKIQARKATVVDQLYRGVQGLMKKNKITVLNGTGAVLGPSIFSPVSGTVSVTFDDKSKEDVMIVPKHVIIATGSSPKTLPSLPIDEKMILTSNGMLELTALPKNSQSSEAVSSASNGLLCLMTLGWMSPSLNFWINW